MKKSNVCIGLINPKSPDNVHSVMRAAGNYRVDGVFYTGDRYPLALQRNPNAPDISRKWGETVPLSEAGCLLDAAKGLKIVCVELAENAIALPDYEHPENAFYIFGPEDGTITQDVVNKADAVVYIPTVGCMNLAATVNVLLYDRLAKSAQKFDDNAVIFESRDRNNTLKVAT